MQSEDATEFIMAPMVSPGAATAEARGQARKEAVVQQMGTSCTVA